MANWWCIITLPMWYKVIPWHNCAVIMGAVVSQITSLTTVYSTVYSDADQRKHRSSASLAFVRGIHRGPMNSPHKWPVTRKMFPFDDVIMVEVWWHHDLETLSALRARYEGKPTVTGFLSQRTSDVELWHFLCRQPEESDEHTAKLSVIWNAMAPATVMNLIS